MWEPPASSLPGAPAALPFVTAVVDDPDGECNSVQNYLVVTVAVRFDLPGRYAYHCPIIEHADTEMMRPFVATVLDMTGGMAPT